MVHVPFFNVDLPEPKLGRLMPDTVSGVLRLTTKALEYGHDLLYPPTPEDLKDFNQQYEATIPREFNRVRKRYADGRIQNDEQLSSELEDASFDWYRRQLRTSVLGATDEEMEDVTARKLGLGRPSLHEAVEQQYLEDALAAAGGVDAQVLIEEAIAQRALQQREAEQREQLAARAKRIATLRRQVRPTSRQAIGTITNASAGMLLGVLLFKSFLTATSRLLRRRKPAQKPQRRPAQVPPPAGVAQGPVQAQQRPGTTAVAAQAQAAAARLQAAVQRQPQVQGQEQGGKGQQASQTPSTSQAGAAAGAARKTRTVKKR